MLATVVKRCTYPTSLLLTYMHVNICRSKAKVKKLPFYCIWGDFTVTCASCTYNCETVPGSLRLWLPRLLFPSKLVWTQETRSEATNLDRRGYILHRPQVPTPTDIFPSIDKCSEHLHHVPRNLPWNTSLHFFLLPSPYQNRIANIG